ncbi:endonuclease/exonuclease/phosphatase family protein [Rathayibacter sp. CAU 1779]
MRGSWRWALSFVMAVIVAGVGVLLTVAPTVGLARAIGISAVLPARTAVTAAALALGVVLALCCLARAGRPLLPIATALLVVAILNVPVVVFRGFSAEAPQAAGAGQLRVLEWNTNGGLVEPSTVAALAARERADVVVLPDAEIASTASAYRAAFDAKGVSFRLYAGTSPGAQVAVFLSPSLAAEYPHAVPGPDADTTIILEPTSSRLPTILALHSPIPTPTGIGHWRDDLDWVTERCGSGSVLVAGDFNASVDDFGGPGLGRCRDAATTRGAASVGTWPMRVPAFLGMPIDHVMLTDGASGVRSFSVLTSEDASGARHRPTLTVIATG